MEGFFVLIPFLLPLLVLLVGLVCGKMAEKSHYRDIHEREAASADTMAVTLEEIDLPHPVGRSDLARGSVVVSIDHWKRLLSGFRMIFGGEMHSYSSLIDRARREAILRMYESTPEADLYLNTRLETSSISKGKNQKVIGCIEVLAYSTAVWYEDDGSPPALPTDEAGSQATG